MNMNLLRKIVEIVLVLLLPLGVRGQALLPVVEKEMTVAERNAAQGFNDTIDRLDPDFVKVSFCMADPTDQTQDYLGITGHAFLRLQCPVFGLDYCFSYESEKIKGQLWDYLTGNLKMGMYAIPTDEYVEDYRVWKRAVHEYHINMPPDAEQRLWEMMDNHMLTEQDMQMNLFKFGCANTLLRYVERALAPTQIKYNWPDKFLTKSAMQITEGHLAEYYPWTMLGIRLIARKEYEGFTAPKQKVIFPSDLLEVWSCATINGEPLLEYVGDLVEAEPVVKQKSWFTPLFCGILVLIVCAGCVIGVFVRKRKK